MVYRSCALLDDLSNVTHFYFTDTPLINHITTTALFQDFLHYWRLDKLQQYQLDYLKVVITEFNTRKLNYGNLHYIRICKV